VLIIEISCWAVRKLISSLVDGELDPEFQMRIEDHLRNCNHCKALVDGTRNVVHLVADERAFELPAGFAERLQQSIEKLRQ